MQHRSPSTQRRRLLQGAGAMASLGIAALPVARAATVDVAGAFAATSFAEAISALGGVPAPSTQIALDAPELAENGAVVPITVTSRLAGTREIIVLVDGNPQPVAARFTIADGTHAFVSTRIRMARSGTIYAAVRTEDGLFVAARATQVTIGGCG
jgi:sulfur-oxidizing protein SoxY